MFSIEKCLDNAHELICVANLFPPVDPDRKGDEINSYMYQSAAFSAIPMQAECLQVPLVRREILGQAKLQTLNYEATENDETEDLFELLRDVKVSQQTSFVQLLAILSECNACIFLSFYFRLDSRMSKEFLAEQLSAAISVFVWRTLVSA